MAQKTVTQKLLEWLDDNHENGINTFSAKDIKNVLETLKSRDKLLIELAFFDANSMDEIIDPIELNAVFEKWYNENFEG